MFSVLKKRKEGDKVWGFLGKGSDALVSVYQKRGRMSQIYRERSLGINFAFFLLIVSSFIFINLIFAKNLNYQDLSKDYKTSTYIEAATLVDTANFFTTASDFLPQLVSSKKADLKTELFSKNRENKLILFILNLLFICIVIYTIGSFTFTVNSIQDLEEQFLGQLERNEELKDQFKEKSRYIRKRFKKKLIDLRNKKRLFVGSVKSFIDEHSVNLNKEANTSMTTYYDDLKHIKTNLKYNKVGIWSWDIEADKVSIDKACFEHLGLKQGAFAGAYSLFLNLFDKSSRRKLKRDIAYAMKFKTSFETLCHTKKTKNKAKALLLKGSAVFDNQNANGQQKIKKIQGILIATECPNRSTSVPKQFFKQPIALFAILDKDFCFEFLNPAWTEYTGFSTHELKEYPMFNFIHQREKRLFLNNLHVLKQDADSSVKCLKYRFRMQDGNFLSLDLSVSYDNYRYYILARPESKKADKSKQIDLLSNNFSFDLQESLDPQYLQS